MFCECAMDSDTKSDFIQLDTMKIPKLASQIRSIKPCGGRA